MKKLITLILILTSITVFGQDIPKMASKIIVKTEGNVESNFIKVKQALAEKGIDIASQDKDIFQIKTGVFPITKYGASAYYIIFCKDNEIQIKGLFNTGIQINGTASNTDSFQQILNKKLGLWGVSFRAMNDFALSLGANLEYQL